MTTELRELEAELKKVAPSLNDDLSHEAAAKLCAWLRTHGDQIDQFDLTTLDALRSHRQFEALQLVAETLNGLGHPHPKVRLYLAQSLIDGGAPSTAVDVLNKLAAKTENAAEKIQTFGLLGRAFKDLYVHTDERNKSRCGDLLNLAIDNYAQAFSQSKETDFWSGENLIGLLNRAARKGQNITANFDANAIANKIEEVISRAPLKERKYWHWASLAIVEVYRRDWDSASEAMKIALERDGATNFAVAGTIRQLREIWDIDDLGDAGAGLLVALQAKLLQLSRGQIEMSREEMQIARAIPESQFEKIFGAEGPRTRAWMQRFLDAGKSVGLISKKLDRGMGTCFIVMGEDFHPSLKGERLILTNDHVVSPKPELYQSSPPLTEDKAEVTFEVFSEETAECTIGLDGIVWSSGAQDHDACLLRLKNDLPDELKAMPTTHRAPIIDEDEPEGVYIIGHPGGRSLSYSMQNNELLDHECKATEGDVSPKRIHYVTPTEPGSSGSPAMNADLDVIGLHHAGAKYMSRLNGQDATYPANEAIWIKSICDAARSDLDAGRDRWQG